MHPRKDPRNRADRFKAALLGAFGRARTDGQQRQFADRRGLIPVVQKAGGLINQLAVSDPACLGKHIHRRAPFRLHRGFVRRSHRNQAGVHDLMQMPSGNVRVAITIGDHFALFGDLDAAFQRGGRMRQNGAVGGAAAAPDAAAAPVKELQRHPVFLANLDQPLLRQIQIPVRGDVAAVLAAVRIADHDLLMRAAPHPARLNVPAVFGILEQRLHDLWPTIQVINRLEQRHKVYIALDADFGCQQQHGQHIAGLFAHAGDHAINHDRAVALVRGGDHAPCVHHPLRIFGKFTDIDREEWPQIADFLDQQILLIALRHFEVLLGEAVIAEQFIQRRRLQACVLPNIHRHQMQPEQAHLANQPQQHSVGDVQAVVLAQAGIHQQQIAQQFAVGGVSVLVQLMPDDVHLLAVDLAGIQVVVHAGAAHRA